MSDEPNWLLTLSTLTKDNTCGLMFSPRDTRKLADAYLELKSQLEIVREAIRKVVEEGVQETSGEYPSAKNNKCRHDRFGFEGCESCIEEFLAKTLAQLQDKTNSGDKI